MTGPSAANPPAAAPQMPAPPAVAAPPPPGSTVAVPPLVRSGLASRPSWGFQTGFIQTRQPAFWLFAILLVICGFLTLADQAKVIGVLPTAYFVSWLLLALWVVPVVIALYFLDTYEREPISLLAAAFLWGAIVATALAVVTNTSLFQILFKLFGQQTTSTWGPALVGPPVEETLKYAGLVLLYLIARTEIDDLFDGFIYGAMIGLGFASVENVQYFLNSVIASGGADQVGPVLQLYLLRVVFSGPYMHMLWTGLTGVGLAYAVTRTDLPRQRRILGAVGMFAAGVVAHFVWNSPILNSVLLSDGSPTGMLVYGLVKGLPFLVFLIVLVYLSNVREARWFRGAMAGEVGAGVVTEDDLGQLVGLRQRWRARRQANALYGPQAATVLARLQREEIALAMVRARVTDENDPDLVRQREVIRGVRAELATAMATPRPQPAPLPPPTPAPTTAPAPVATHEPAGATTSTPAPMPAATPEPAAVPVPPAPAPAWAPTHVVPVGGMLTWPAPDPRYPPSVTLAPGLELQLLERSGDWARVAAANGWSGWVDGRQLLPRIG